MRRDNFVNFGDVQLGPSLQDVSGVPERFAGMLGAIVERLLIVKLVADLKSNDTPFGREFLHQVVRHIARDVVDRAHAMVRGQDRIRTGVDRLGDCLVRAM